MKPFLKQLIDCIESWVLIGAFIIFIILIFGHLPTGEKKNKAITPAVLQERIQQTRTYVAILETINYYKTNNDDNGYSQNAEHLLQVWNFCKVYAPMITEDCWIEQLRQPETYKAKIRAEIESIDIPLFMFCLCSDESGFQPDAIHINKNKSQDSGITQINQTCQSEITARMQITDFKDRPWTDMEKNIAGRYIWIMMRAKDGMAWKQMTKRRGWKLYKLISEKIKNFQLTQGGSDERYTTTAAD
jgi:hypothetical protein